MRKTFRNIFVVLFLVVLAFSTQQVFAQTTTTGTNGTILNAPSGTNLPLFIIYPGIDPYDGTWIKNKINSTIYGKYLVAIATKDSTAFNLVQADIDSFATTNNITITNKSIAGFSGGATIVQEQNSSDYVLVGLIDPSTNETYAAKNWGNNVKMIYRVSNWGDQYAAIKTALPKLAQKIKDGGGFAEEIQTGHLNMPKEFFDKYISSTGSGSNSNPSGGTTLAQTSNYLTKNPTEDLKQGVIQAGGLPTIRGLADPTTKQIPTGVGIQAGQSIVTTIILYMLRLIGVLALIGILYNAFLLVTHPGEEETHTKAMNGLKWSIFGLVIALISHALVTALVQILTQVD